MRSNYFKNTAQTSPNSIETKFAQEYGIVKNIVAYALYFSGQGVGTGSIPIPLCNIEMCNIGYCTFDENSAFNIFGCGKYL